MVGLAGGEPGRRWAATKDEHGLLRASQVGEESRGQQTLAFERVKYGKVQHETQQTPASGATNSHFMSKLLEFGWF
jgi:hypothetical protein